MIRPHAFVSLVLASAALAGSLEAQQYTKKVLLRNLASPTGILVEPNGDLVYSQIPVRGKFDQKNMVSRRIAKTGKIELLVAGEPAPVNFGRTASGDLYWCCVTAGVIIRKQVNSTGVRVFRSGLRNPNGMAISQKTGNIYITQIPTPGSGGSKGRNTVDLLTSTGTTALSTGEPEPFDITVDSNENLYWTCRSAGVILRRDAKTGKNSMVLNGLEKPSGLAMDSMGNLYFTEVPTPAKSGANGGRNKVWKYDPKTRNLTLISFGEPEPTDVTVSADGSKVYWTCTSAGVIIEATRSGDGGTVTTNSMTKLGSTVALTFNAKGEGGKLYAAATSAGLGPTTFGTSMVALSQDVVFWLTLLNSGNITTGYVGTLNGSGVANGTLVLPKLNELRGIKLNTAFVTLNNTMVSSIRRVSSTLRFEVQ